METVVCQFCGYMDNADKFEFGGHKGGRQIWVHFCPKCSGWTQASTAFLADRKAKSSSVLECFKDSEIVKALDK